MVTWPQIVTAIVAGMALALSIVGLVIQYRTWVTAGARISGVWRHGIAIVPQATSYFAVDQPVRTISIELTNRGRTAGEVQQVTFERADGEDRSHLYIPPPNWLTTEPSGPIPPHSTRSWTLLAEPLGEAHRMGWRSVRPRVLLGDAKVLLLDPFHLGGITEVSPESDS